MRIPFVPKNVMIHKDRYEFIQQYRGGGFMQIASSIYWLLAFILTYFLDKPILTNYYIFGGFIIPIVGYVTYKLLQLKAAPNQYTSLVGFASAITACCFPILLLIRDYDLQMILPVLCIISSSHLLILGWVHLDYLYMIKTAIGVCLGMAFIFSVPSEYIHFICLIYGFITLLFGVIIHVASKTPLKGYDFQIIDE